MGIIDKVGPAVTAFKVGDRVLISCIGACGQCVYCRKLMYSHCTTGGWILGKTDPKLLITHRFKLDRILDAYDTFAHAANTRALKVIIEA